MSNNNNYSFHEKNSLASNWNDGALKSHQQLGNYYNFYFATHLYNRKEAYKKPAFFIVFPGSTFYIYSCTSLFVVFFMLLH